MYNKFKEQEINTKLDFLQSAYKHYFDHLQTPPFSKLEDMWDEYQVITGIMTIRDHIKMKYNI